jgi:hypothetical protein
MSTNAEYQAQLTERWQQRQSALLKVSVTVGEALIVVLAGAMALVESRS